MVEDAAIEPALRGLDLQLGAQALVDLACARNEKDNITVVMMLVPWRDTLSKPDLRTGKKERKFWRWVMLSLVGLILLALVTAVLALVIIHFVPALISEPTPTP